MLFRPFVLTACALLAVSSTGCLFSGRPCEPGDWHYHSCDCRHAAASAPCQTCTRRSPIDGVGDTERDAKRPMIQPSPARIPPLPSPATGAMRQSGPTRANLPQVTQLQWVEPYRPRTSTTARSVPVSAQNKDDRDVQKCGWQQPDDTHSRSKAATDTTHGLTPRSPTAKHAGGAASAKNAGSHPPPVASDLSVNKPEPFAWGYFGAMGQW